MKINVVGGGPAGLYFALLLKAHSADHEISVYERNSAGVTWGWGVVFSSKTLDYLAGADKALFDDFQRRLVKWTDVVMLYQEREVRVRGNPFSAIARIGLLESLLARCQALGVKVHFDHSVDDIEALRDCDLLIGADGINSLVRDAYAATFQPTITPGKNTFCWLGTHHLFDGLTLGFVESDAGPFACHAYQYCDNLSTFIPECSEETYRRAGLHEMSESESLAYLAKVFQRELDGQALISNNSTWIHFREVKNHRWHHENVVLMGDALHTAHFSIGSGTKLAMEDAIVLAELCSEHVSGSSLEPLFRRYEEERRPAVEKLQRAALTSQQWFEQMGDKLGPDPYLFAYDCMTRSGRVDMDLLREQDPDFVENYERAVASA